LGDLEDAFAIYSDEEVMRYFGRPPSKDLDEQRERLVALVERCRGDDPNLSAWALVSKETDRVVGTTILKPLPGSNKVEVGWHLGRAHWGKGFATESGEGALRHGFQVVGLNVIYAVVHPENSRSVAVCNRLGMTLEELTDNYYGQTLKLFSLSRGTWEQDRSSESLGS
jgi:RimJ/RimL family protein N-acetyltransferase